jgi:hypothetical protein
MFLDNSDIFIGFLWLIDLGVGLVFLIFILHFSNFLYKKIELRINFKIFLLAPIMVSIFILFVLYNSSNYISLFTNFNYLIFSFNILWYDYYDIFNNLFKTDLNLLREIYFFNNSLEFIIINFLILYGILNSIIFFFLIKKIFNVLNFDQIYYLNLLNKKTSFFFIRNQNLINQQDEGASLKIWLKKNDSKKNVFKDFR